MFLKRLHKQCRHSGAVVSLRSFWAGRLRFGTANTACASRWKIFNVADWQSSLWTIKQAGKIFRPSDKKNFLRKFYRRNAQRKKEIQQESANWFRCRYFFDKEKKKNRFFKQLCDVPETRKRPFSIIYICRIICIMYSYCFIDNGLINKRKILKQAPKTAFRTRTKLFLSAKLNLFCFPACQPYFQTFSAR